MAEIASDELIASITEKAKHVKHYAVIPGFDLRAILARLRKAETDNANMAKLLSGYARICREAGIAPASSEIYAAPISREALQSVRQFVATNSGPVNRNHVVGLLALLDHQDEVLRLVEDWWDNEGADRVGEPPYCIFALRRARKASRP